MIDETRETTESQKKATDNRLQDRVVWIKFLKDEAQIQKNEICKEEEALKTYRKRTINAIEALREKSQKICQQCIILRENRRGFDMVNDEVDLELSRELKIVKGCQELLNKTLEETNEQIRRIRAIKYLLDRNLFEKEKSIEIDEHNLKLKHNQLDMSIYEGQQPLNPLLEMFYILIFFISTISIFQQFNKLGMARNDIQKYQRHCKRVELCKNSTILC